MVKDRIYTIKKDKQGGEIYHLIDAGGCMTRCGNYSAWGSSVKGGSTTDTDIHDLSVANANGNFCSLCLREAPVKSERGWDGETPIYKRHGEYVNDIDALLTWLKEQRRSYRSTSANSPKA